MKPEITTFKCVKKERNPKIVKALQRAVNELAPRHPKYLTVMFVYIDGDPYMRRLINLN